MFDIRIDVPYSKPIFDSLTCLRRGGIVTRLTRFGPMRFVNTGEVADDGRIVFRIPPPPPDPLANLESVWDGLASLLGERDEQTAEVYTLGCDGELGTEAIPAAYSGLKSAKKVA